eukprot:6072037-Pleurochrysis_carterae.AAC.1
MRLDPHGSTATVAGRQVTGARLSGHLISALDSGRPVGLKKHQPQQREHINFRQHHRDARGADSGGDNAPAPAAGAIRYDVDVPTRLAQRAFLHSVRSAL